MLGWIAVRTLQVLALLFVFVLLPLGATAGPPDVESLDPPPVRIDKVSVPRVEKLDLGDFVARAVEAAPEIDVARWEVLQQEANLQKARANSEWDEIVAMSLFH